MAMSMNRKGSASLLFVGIIVIAAALFAGFYYMTQEYKKPYQYTYTEANELLYKFNIYEEGGLFGNGTAYLFETKPEGFDHCDQTILQDELSEAKLSKSLGAGVVSFYLKGGGKHYYIVVTDDQASPENYWACEEVTTPTSGTQSPQDFEKVLDIVLDKLPTVSLSPSGNVDLDIDGTIGNQTDYQYIVTKSVVVSDGKAKLRTLKLTSVAKNDVDKIEIQAFGKSKKTIWDYTRDIDELSDSEYKMELYGTEIPEGSSGTIMITLKFDSLNTTASTGDHYLEPGETVASVTVTDLSGTSIASFSISG